MASVDGAAGEGATDGGGGQFVSRVPSPVTPNLPVSHHVDRVYTERQGRGGGFTKGKIDPAKLLDNLNQERRFQFHYPIISPSSGVIRIAPTA